MPEMDFHVRSDIEGAFRRVDALLSCGIFKPEASGHVLFRAAFVELLIAMRDLMFKAERYADRISFDDDVEKFEKVSDVTDLIKHVRDAICHPDSDNHFLVKGSIKSSFNVVFGSGSLLQMGDVIQGSEYEDDICFFFGKGKIYLNRHIVRAFKEAEEKLKPLCRLR